MNHSISQYKQHKILILQGTQTQNEHVDIDNIYINVNYFTKMIKKLHEHTPIPFKEYWYGEWKKDIKNYDVFIIFDGLRGKDVIEYIKKVNPSARIIIYYVNKFRKGARNDPRNFRNLPCELWSFDKNDCEREILKHNPFCYDDILFAEKNKRAFYDKEADEIIYDAFFIGVDKNRLTKLVELKHLLEKYNYKTKVILKKAKNHLYKNLSQEEESILTEQYISYEDVIKLIRQSQCIIEIEDEGQNGLTLRSMESIFFNKKLITDNLDILNYDLYKQENIFLLGYDEEARLDTFLSSPFAPIEDNVIKQYTWEAWLNRFFEKN